MASFWYSPGVKELLDRTDNATLHASATYNLKIMLCTATYTAVNTDTFIDMSSGSDAESGEITATGGYVRGFGNAGRQALVDGGKAFGTATTPNRAYFDYTADFTWTALTGSDTITQAVIVHEKTTNADSRMFFHLDGFSVTINGGNFVLSFATEGVGYIQC